MSEAQTTQIFLCSNKYTHRTGVNRSSDLSYLLCVSNFNPPPIKSLTSEMSLLYFLITLIDYFVRKNMFSFLEFVVSLGFNKRDLNF